MSYNEVLEILKHKKATLFFKRLFDIFVSGCGILVLLPVFLVVSIAIKLDSRGPVMFRQIRVGKNCRIFNILKFRTMVFNAEAIGNTITISEDVRITKFGKFLRKTKIDELAQLFNVFSGKMSFVGPRPLVPSTAAMYGEDGCKAVYSVRPGITDLASIYFSNEGELLAAAPDPDAYYEHVIIPKKRELVQEYIRKMSPLFDIKLIFRTVFGRRNGAELPVSAHGAIEAAATTQETGEEILPEGSAMLPDSGVSFDLEGDISNADNAENVVGEPNGAEEVTSVSNIGIADDNEKDYEETQVV